MPLKAGSSIETIGGNIGDMIDKYKETGKIGNVTPRSMAHAQQIATAAANQKAGDAKPTKVNSFKKGGMNEGAGDMNMEKAKHEVAESVKRSGKEAGERIEKASNYTMIPRELKKTKKMK
jgi:hypothetical protein